MINARWQARGRAQAERVARLLRWTRLTPIALTAIGLLLNGVAAGLLAGGWLVAGGLLILVAGLFDLLDGAMGRITGRLTPLARFLDSTADRYSEALLYAGLLYHILDGADARTGALLIHAAAGGSLLVSYTRARAEALGYQLQVGLLPRPERLIILAAGLILGQISWTLWLLALLTNVTAVQRIVHLWRLAGPPPGVGPRA